MDKRDIIVIGTSAGGVEALQALCRGLPADLPAALLIVQHLSPTSGSMLPQLLSRAGLLPAVAPREGESVQPGRIYVAPPDLHMLLKDNSIILRRGPPENRCRPAIDALFRSAALLYGPRVIGVILTGLLDDGAEGLALVKRAGGLTIVQDPADAAWPAMPRHALAQSAVDHCVTLAEIPMLLARLARQEAGPSHALPAETSDEARIAEQQFASLDQGLQSPGRPSVFGCPSCGGVLNEIESNDKTRYRCQIGHAFTATDLAEAQNQEMERALAVAVRTHRDRLSLFRRMESSARGARQPHAAERWRLAAEEAERLAAVLETAMSNLRHPVQMLDIPS